MSSNPRIHPTAIVGPDVQLAEDTLVGPYAVLEGKITVGSGCTIGQGVRLTGIVHLGNNNHLYPYVVVGEDPQHLRYAGEPTSVEIGDNNTFREHVTVHRATTHSWRTVIGNNNFFMANSHVAHDCVVGNQCMFANGALLAGHCVIADNVVLSGNSALHQFCRMGRIAMLSGLSGSTRDVPPFLIVQNINGILGVNVVGMRRAGIPGEQIDGVRRAYFLLFKLGLTVSAAVERVNSEVGHLPAVQEMVSFIRETKRGIMLREVREAA